MKIRTDFVTNSSSSSFVLGKPNECKLTVKDGKKYLAEIQRQLAVDGIYCEHIIDLKYDENKHYDTEQVQFVLESIIWYDEKLCGDEAFWFITEEGEYIEIEMYQEKYTKEEIKFIFDYAHEHLGEILLGSCEMAFHPYEAYDNFIRHNDSIVFKSNHMG